MVAFVLEHAAYRSERLGQRKDVGGDEQVGVPGSYRMPVDPFCCYGDLRYQIDACQRDTLRGGTTQSYASDYPVLFSDLVGIQEAAELVDLVLSGDGRR
jgi:hypothetical protein